MDDERTGTLWTLDPDTRAAMRLDRVREAMRQQQWETAIVEVEEFLDESPQHPDALFLLGESLLELGDAALACEVYSDQVELTGGKQPASLLGLAIARFETCDLPGSAQAAREVIRQDPGNAEAHFTLGLALERQKGRSVEAASALSAAARLDPEGFPFPLTISAEGWSSVIGSALASLHPTLRGFWSGVPIRLLDLPDLAELRRHEPVLPPTVMALFIGTPPDEGQASASRPDALRLFTRNLTRVHSEDQLVEQVAVALEQEALEWLGMTTEEL